MVCQFTSTHIYSLTVDPFVEIMFGPLNPKTKVHIDIGESVSVRNPLKVWHVCFVIDGEPQTGSSNRRNHLLFLS